MQSKGLKPAKSPLLQTAPFHTLQNLDAVAVFTEQLAGHVNSLVNSISLPLPYMTRKLQKAYFLCAMNLFHKKKKESHHGLCHVALYNF